MPRSSLLTTLLKLFGLPILAPPARARPRDDRYRGGDAPEGDLWTVTDSGPRGTSHR